MNSLSYITIGKENRQARFTHDYVERKKEEGFAIEHINTGYWDEIPLTNGKTKVVKLCTTDDKIKNKRPNFLKSEDYFNFFREIIENKDEEVRKTLGKIEYVNSPDSYILSRDKLLTFKNLEEIGIKTPETCELTIENFYNLLNNHGRVCVKPKMGFHGKGLTSIKKNNKKYEVITNLNPKNLLESEFDDFKKYLMEKNQLENFIEKYSELGGVVQEWIKGKKYEEKNFDVRNINIFDELIQGIRTSETIATNLHLTERPEDNIFSPKDFLDKKILDREEFEEMKKITQKISKDLKMNFLGVDFYIDEENPKILEINPLPGTQIPLKLGINPMHLELDEILERYYYD